MFGIAPNAMAYDWSKAITPYRGQMMCLKDLSSGMQKPPSCNGQTPDAVFSRTWSGTGVTVHNIDGVPSAVIDFVYWQPFNDFRIPIKPFTVPVSKGKEGNYVEITMAARIQAIDEDDPLYNPVDAHVINATLIIEAVKGRPPTIVEKMLGEVIMDKEFPDRIASDYQTDKAKRIEQARIEEQKVKLFGQEIYGANRGALNTDLAKVGLNRKGSIPGKQSDVFDSSSKVPGTSQLALQYDDHNHIGLAVYTFPKASKHDVIERLAKVYGPANASDAWRIGRITIQVAEKMQGAEGAELRYIVMPYYKHLANAIIDNSADMNAF